MDNMLDNAKSILDIIAVLFVVFLYFKKPQIKSEMFDAVFEEKFKNLNATVVNLRDNHIHTLDSKLDQHIKDNQIASEANIRQMTRIETLLEERLPHK